MNQVELALRLKKLRTDRGLTLEQVAAHAGLTRGWLSKVENFRVTPSLQALSAIAQALGVSLSELFSGLDERPPIVVVRRGERTKVVRDEEQSTLEYEALAHSRLSRSMDPFVIRIPPTEDRPLLAHGGEEFMFVLRGRVRLDYGEQTHTLNRGDSAYFDGNTPHSVACVDDQPSVVLVVYTNVGGDHEINGAEAQ